MWHRAGDITVTKGSKTVTGAGGTTWVENIRVGDGLQGPDGRLYEVTNVASDTTLAIEPAYLGETASGMPYWIIPVLGYQKLLADRAAALVGAVGQLPSDVQENERRIANAEQALSSLGGASELNVGTTEGTVAAGDDSRITGAIQQSGNLSDLQNKENARDNLGLGSAATKNTGTNEGEVLLSGNAFGLGAYYAVAKNTWAGLLQSPTGYYRAEFPLDNIYAGAMVYCYDYYNRHAIFSKNFGADRHSIISATSIGNETEAWRWSVLMTSENTTVDSNGFLKRASPIVKLYNARIEKTEHLEINDAEFIRIDVGHYEIRNVPLLSRDGWYIETPKDRNNNIYFTVDYEENIEEKTLTIRTYEPDYSLGRVTNGVPVDILDGRFISLRFSEDPSLYPDPEIPEQDVPAA
ncbi:hypothetical protein ACLO87_09320 [Paenalcaligenes sp. Me52]|uniref:phage tail fiber protein n=1 Tax=Paenalcaligenes sp. Me52 TaxID=3392038 RepID=UPI003D284A13